MTDLRNGSLTGEISKILQQNHYFQQMSATREEPQVSKTSEYVNYPHGWLDFQDVDTLKTTLVIIYAKLCTKKSTATNQSRKFADFCKYFFKIKFEETGKTKIKEFYTSFKEFGSQEQNQKYYLDALRSGQWKLLEDTKIFLTPPSSLLKKVKLNLATNSRVAPDFRRKSTSSKKKGSSATKMSSKNSKKKAVENIEFMPSLSNGSCVLYCTKMFMKFAVMVKALYNKIDEIKKYSREKTEKDIDLLIEEHPSLRSHRSKFIQERTLYTIGLLFSILKCPKEYGKFEDTSRSLLGTKHYIFKYVNFSFSCLLSMIQSISSEGWSAKVWHLFDKHNP